MTTMPDESKLGVDLAAAFKVLNRGRAGYLKGQSYYEGDVAEMTAGNARVQRILQQSAEQHKLVFANIPVDALMGKVALSAISSDNAEAKAYLADFMDDADLLDEFADWATKAGYFGDYYVVLDADTETDEGTDAETGEPLPGTLSEWRPIGSSPLSTVAVYSPKDSTELLYFVKRWQIGDHWEANVFYDDCTVAMRTPMNTKGEGDDATKYVLSEETDDDDNPIPGSAIVKHLGGKPLAVHLAVDGKPYGKPLHRNAYGPQDAINKIHATYLATVETIGFPMRYGLQDPQAALEDDDLDEDFGRDGLGVDASHPSTGTGADGRLEVAAGSKLKATPGGFWSLRGFKAVGQFPAADQAGFFHSLDWEVRAMSTTTGTPFYEFDETGTPPSGASRRLANGRINKHAEKVIRQLQQGCITLGETVLAAAGIKPGKVTAEFEPAELETDEDGMALVELKVKQGVPINLALREAGYPAVDVDKWWPPKNTAALAPQLWQELGAFMRFAATAVAGEAVTPSELQNMLPQYITEVREPGFATPKPPPPPIVVGAPGGLVPGQQTPLDNELSANAAAAALGNAAAKPAAAPAKLPPALAKP